MARHIVFTGPDGAGKSTHLEMMMNKLMFFKDTHTIITARAIRYDRTNPRELPLIMDMLLDSIEKDDRRNTIVLHDRWNYPEEVIYPKVLGGVVSDLAKVSEHIEERINALGDKVFFLVFNAPPHILQERLETRGGEDYIEMKHLRDLSQEYERFAKTSKISNLQYIYDDGTKVQELVYRNFFDELTRKKGFF